MKARRRRQARSKPSKIPELVSSGVGTIERLQHGDVIERQATVMLDEFGQFAQPFRNVDILDRYTRGPVPKLTPEMRTAGQTFREMFRFAHLDQLRAGSMIPKVDGNPTFEDTGASTDRAVKFVNNAMRALGGTNSPAGSCVWFVLGEGYSIRDWAKKCGYSGRLVSEDEAPGILVAALGVLAGPENFA